MCSTHCVLYPVFYDRDSIPCAMHTVHRERRIIRNGELHTNLVDTISLLRCIKIQMK